MRKIWTLVFSVIFVIALAACGGAPSGAGAGGGPPSTLPEKAEPGPGSAQPPDPKKPPPILMPEDVLSEADATEFVGCPVKIETSSPDGEDQTGIATQSYVYDLPKEIDYYESTVLALLEITQNGLIPAEELAAGYDAKWAYETTKNMVAGQISSIPGLGEDAFYLNETSQVHFLFRDYYVVIAFINTKEQYSQPEDLALNKRIAAHIADALSLADVTLS